MTVADSGDGDPPLVVIDTQFVRVAAGVPRTTTGLDVDKKMSGRRRGLVVDVMGRITASWCWPPPRTVTPKPTGAKRAELLRALAAADPDIVKYEDKAIHAARNQRSAINSGSSKADRQHPSASPTKMSRPPKPRGTRSRGRAWSTRPAWEADTPMVRSPRATSRLRPAQRHI
ncbi:hypothetical protein [Streptomyces sp. HUAS TT20]|uniref:hypothetical protein n=1 Tax=Streptomyces sp. HUAS TT20 TaxID=3447509 RepID=UPI0021D90BBA|nr:hypothetical protein N8I87_39430 [Streptomyces sp. HUAS 15-9]